MSKTSSQRPKRPVVEVEFVQTETYSLVDNKSRPASQGADASSSQSEPTVSNSNSTPLDSKNVLLTEEEEELSAADESQSFLVGAVIGLGLIVGGYYAWRWWNMPPPLTK